MWCSCAAIKAGISSSFAHQFSSPKIQRFQPFFFLYIFIIIFSGGRSSLNNGNDKTTYGAFLDADPSREELSLRSLVSCCYEILQFYSNSSTFQRARQAFMASTPYISGTLRAKWNCVDIEFAFKISFFFLLLFFFTKWVYFCIAQFFIYQRFI